MGRRETRQAPPLVAGQCDYCGGKCEGRKFCTPDCQREFNKMCQVQGKAILPHARIWWARRNAKGAQAVEERDKAIRSMCEVLNECAQEERERRK